MATLSLVILPAVAWGRPTARLALERGAGAESCPDAESLRRTVEGRLGYRALRDDANATIAVRFDRDATGRFTSHVTQRDAQDLAMGERALDGDDQDCVDVADATALTISVLLESVSVARRSDAGSAAQHASRAEASPPTLAEPARAPTLTPRVRFEGTASVGVSPSPAPGVGLGVGLARGAWSLDLEGRIDQPTEAALGEGRVRSSLRLAQIVPCRHVGFLSGCAVFGAGLVAVEGLEVVNARSDSRFHAAIGVR